MNLLPQLLQCWDYRCALLCLDQNPFWVRWGSYISQEFQKRSPAMIEPCPHLTLAGLTHRTHLTTSHKVTLPWGGTRAPWAWAWLCHLLTLSSGRVHGLLWVQFSPTHHIGLVLTFRSDCHDAVCWCWLPLPHCGESVPPSAQHTADTRVLYPALASGPTSYLCEETAPQTAKLCGARENPGGAVSPGLGSL